MVQCCPFFCWGSACAAASMCLWLMSLGRISWCFLMKNCWINIFLLRVQSLILRLLSTPSVLLVLSEKTRARLRCTLAPTPTPTPPPPHARSCGCLLVSLLVTAFVAALLCTMLLVCHASFCVSPFLVLLHIIWGLLPVPLWLCLLEVLLCTQRGSHSAKGRVSAF